MPPARLAPRDISPKDYPEPPSSEGMVDLDAALRNRVGGARVAHGLYEPLDPGAMLPYAPRDPHPLAQMLGRFARLRFPSVINEEGEAITYEDRELMHLLEGPGIVYHDAVARETAYRNQHFGYRYATEMYLTFRRNPNPQDSQLDFLTAFSDADVFNGIPIVNVPDPDDPHGVRLLYEIPPNYVAEELEEQAVENEMTPNAVARGVAYVLKWKKARELGYTGDLDDFQSESRAGYAAYRKLPTEGDTLGYVVRAGEFMQGAKPFMTRSERKTASEILLMRTYATACAMTRMIGKQQNPAYRGPRLGGMLGAVDVYDPLAKDLVGSCAYYLANTGTLGDLGIEDQNQLREFLDTPDPRFDTRRADIADRLKGALYFRAFPGGFSAPPLVSIRGTKKPGSTSQLPLSEVWCLPSWHYARNPYEAAEHYDEIREWLAHEPHAENMRKDRRFRGPGSLPLLPGYVRVFRFFTRSTPGARDHGEELHVVSGNASPGFGYDFVTRNFNQFSWMYEEDLPAGDRATLASIYSGDYAIGGERFESPRKKRGSRVVDEFAGHAVALLDLTDVSRPDNAVDGELIGPRHGFSVVDTFTEGEVAMFAVPDPARETPGGIEEPLAITTGSLTERQVKKMQRMDDKAANPGRWQRWFRGADGRLPDHNVQDLVPAYPVPAGHEEAAAMFIDPRGTPWVARTRKKNPNDPLPEAQFMVGPKQGHRRPAKR